MAQIIGKRIYIITTDFIRYEGTAESINTIAKTLTLENVINFGTEDRPAPVFYPPSTRTILSMTFVQTDIQTIILVPPGSEHTTPLAPVTSQAPATAPSSSSSSSPSPVPAATTTQTAPTSTTQDALASVIDDDDDDQKNKQEDEEFDIHTANAKEQALEKPVEVVAATKMYDKNKSFFDDMGSAPSNQRGLFRNNYDTFGETGQLQRRSHHQQRQSNPNDRGTNLSQTTVNFNNQGYRRNNNNQQRGQGGSYRGGNNRGRGNPRRNFQHQPSQFQNDSDA